MSCSKTIGFFALSAILLFSAPVLIDVNQQANGVNTKEFQKAKDNIFKAVSEGDLTTVKEILTKYPELIKAKRNGGWTLLHTARNNRKLVEYLLQKGADIHAKSDGGWTPLHSHSYRGNKDGVELLLEKGAGIEVKHNHGMTPLINAIRWNRIEAVKVLVNKGANVDTTDLLGRTPLILSAIHGYAQLAAILLNNGADICATENSYKRTALHFAALNGHLPIVKELVKKGADINIKDADGKTPLYYACRYGHEKVAITLKSSGAKEKINPKNFGYSPWMKKQLKDGQAVAWALGRIGYAVKTKNHLLIFSYHVYGSEPDEPRLANGHIHIDEINSQKTIVFAGGPPYWHHNPERFHRWQKIHPNISFIYSFEDKKGRNPNYFKDVDGPTYAYLPSSEKMQKGGLIVENVPVLRGSGFLVEVDGLVIFHGGDHTLLSDSQEKSFKKTIDYLKEIGKNIDLLIMAGNFTYGKVWPLNIKGVDYAAKILKPKAFLIMATDSSEFVLKEVYSALKKYSSHTKVFYPDHRGDSFLFGIDER